MPDSHLPPPPLWRSLRKIAPYFGGHRAGLLGVVGLAVLVATLSALEPLVVKALFDSFLSSEGVWRAMAPFAILVGLLAVRECIALVNDRLFWRVRVGMNFGLLQATVERLHALPLSFHREESVGATMTKIERGIAGAMTAFTEVVVQLFPAIIYLVVSVVVMVHIDVRLSLVVCAFAPLPAIVGALAAKEQARREHTLMDRWTKIFARFNEVLTGIVVVKSFSMEEQEKRRFLGGVDDANGVVLRGVVRDSKTNAIKNWMMVMARITALGVGGYFVMRHTMTLGSLIAFVSYLGGLFAPIQTLTGMYATLNRASVCVDSVLSILDAQDALGDAPDARDTGEVSGDVSFEDVTFAYRPGCPVIKGVNLDVKKGEHVALVGPSGSGKSTLMALLQRLYDPTSGSIRVDGHDIREFKQRSLRSQIGVVLQDGMLFNDSVFDNIAFGVPLAGRAEVEAAARAANAHDFIMALPDGYDTVIGERGAKLSGGERQRIAIARTLLKDAPILILDEATSALDAESEEQVQSALGRLAEGRTTFLIAHRLATVTQADRIVVFKGGSIAEIGTHESLLRQNGYYASLVQKQLRGLVAELWFFLFAAPYVSEAPPSRMLTSSLPPPDAIYVETPVRQPSEPPPRIQSETSIS
ncbi:MAG TPA: ABC transporter ATP-binding protein [Polyangiaceae bacterium]|nr:ABC transporter ATP-binding protein [Polyangiaceae bacterium]